MVTSYGVEAHCNVFQEDIESVVRAIEEEERRRSEVKESVVEPPSERSNFSINAHTENPELVFFGGEFYNGQKVGRKCGISQEFGSWCNVMVRA